MKLILSIILLLCCLVALGHTQAINILPNNAARKLRDAASAAGWRAANVRAGYSSDAARDLNNVQDRIAEFKELMEGIISSQTADKIKRMFEYAGWHTANTRHGYHSDARRDRDRVNSYHSEIVDSGELSRSLVNDIRSMGWAAAWYSANIRAGYSGDAANDRRRRNTYYDRIRGDVNLVAVNFFPDDFRITEASPSLLCRVRLPNCGSTTSQDQCSIVQSIGRTITTSLDVRFDYSITNEFSSSIEFDGIGGVGTSYSASYTFSEGSSFSESIEHTTTISRTFTVNGAPNTYTVGNVVVQEQTGSLPYELVFDFEGVRKSVRGMWTGVLVSDALLHTQEYTPCTATPNE